MKQANLDKKFDYYKLSYIFKNNKLIKLEIKLNISNIIKEKDSNKNNNNNNNNNKDNKSIKYSNIKIILLNNSLYNLSNFFKVSVIKGYFPHKFVKKDKFSVNILMT